MIYKETVVTTIFMIAMHIHKVNEISACEYLFKSKKKKNKSKQKAKNVKCLLLRKLQGTEHVSLKAMSKPPRFIIYDLLQV